MTSFIESMRSIDRRWIYLALSATLVVALLLGKPLTPVVLPYVQKLYDTVEQAPAGRGQGKIILIGITFASSTLGENGTQARALIRHLMLAHKRFAIIAVGEPQGAMLGQAIASDLAKQYGYVYGTDWIDFGYQIGTLAFFKSFPKDIPANIKVDGLQQKPLASFPIMQGIKTMNDVALHVEITASASLSDWIQLVQPTTSPRLKIAYGCTGVMATEAYPYLDSGQLIGMMPGLKGAADYEWLVDQREQKAFEAGEVKDRYDPKRYNSVNLPAPARQLMYTQNAAHLVVILFILLGNLGLLLSKKTRPAKKEDRHA